MKRLPGTAILASVLLVPMVMLTTLVACGRDGTTPAPPGSTGSPPASTPTATPPGTPSSTAPGTATSPPGGSTSSWTSGPTTVNRSVPVPPVPRLLRIRSAAHSDEGFDRVTFDFVQVLPGYDVRYVDEVLADGSGLPVNVPGRRFLQITFRPAQAHDDTGTVSVTPRAMTLNYPMLEAYAITGDFEGVLTVVLGLDDVVGYRIGELPGQPGRIYIDVAA